MKIRKIKLFSTLEEECRKVGKSKMEKGKAILVMTRAEFMKALSKEFWVSFFPKDVAYSSCSQLMRRILVKVNFIGGRKLYVEFVKP